MMSAFIEDDEYEDDPDAYDEYGSCYNCDGSGWIVVCVDDMCRGMGECIHGDGDMPCPICNEDCNKDRW